MLDREKVIKGLTICRHKVICQENCMECPYIYDKRSKRSNCEGVLHEDAIALLKEQKKRINELEEKLRLLEYGDQDTVQPLLMPAT